MSRAKADLHLVTPDDLVNPQAMIRAQWDTTDIANADGFVDQHRDQLRFQRLGRGWYRWRDGRWEVDVTNSTLALAQTTVKGWWSEVGTKGSPEERRMRAAHLLKTGKRSRIVDMLTLAQTDPRVAVPPDCFDQDPWLLTTPNGTIDLRTGVLREHRPTDLISKRTPVVYDPKAECPRFLKFLGTILDSNEDLLGFMQRLAGYSATGSTREQCLPFGWGGGANGKSTLLECLHMALGEYARTAPPSLLMASKYESHPTEVADLMGARLVSTIETEQDRHLAEVKVKWLTGEKTLKARFMRQDFFEFTPTHTFWLLGNHKPVVKGQDAAIWRRIHLVPFTVDLRAKFGPENLVRDFSATLADELPGILRWIVDGAVTWFAEGLRPPEIVRVATSNYQMEMDAVGQWVDEFCERGPFKAPFAALFTAYIAHADDKVSKRVLAQELDRLGIHDRVVGGIHFRQGVRLRETTHD